MNRNSAGNQKRKNKKANLASPEEDIVISNDFFKQYYVYAWLGCVVLICVVLLLLIFLWKHTSYDHIPNYQKYPLLSKRVFLKEPNDLIINFTPLRKALKTYVEEQGDSVGVYFEYLPSGSSIGANDTDGFKLASLSKVPLAMSILKKIEKGELSLDTPIVLRKEHLNDGFGNLWKAGEGATFSIKELLEQNLIYSDNTAYEALFSLLTTEEVLDVYDDLEIEVTSKETDPHVSPKSYSSILRSLYLSTYLSLENSQYVLDVLTKTPFNNKIAQPLSSEIKVAHKIGVFALENEEGKVYSDCGIIYYPLRPYILCIFVQGEESEAIQHMQLISTMVYGYINLVKNAEYE